MSVKSLMFLTSALASAGLVIEPVAAAANGLSQLGTWGLPQGAARTVSNVRCDGAPGVGSNILQMNVPRVPGANGSNNNSAFRPSVNAGANSPGNTGISKALNVYNHNSDNTGANAERRSQYRSRQPHLFRQAAECLWRRRRERCTGGRGDRQQPPRFLRQRSPCQ